MLRDLQRYIFFKIKDSTGYGGIHMLQKPINRPSKYIFLLCYLLLEKIEEKKALSALNLLNVRKLRNGKVQYKKSKRL